eukprot:3264878-Pyramimonas_sp.AAC.1
MLATFDPGPSSLFVCLLVDVPHLAIPGEREHPPPRRDGAHAVVHRVRHVHVAVRVRRHPVRRVEPRSLRLNPPVIAHLSVIGIINPKTLKQLLTKRGRCRD